MSQLKQRRKEDNQAKEALQQEVSELKEQLADARAQCIESTAIDYWKDEAKRHEEAHKETERQSRRNEQANEFLIDEMDKQKNEHQDLLKRQ